MPINHKRTQQHSSCSERIRSSDLSGMIPEMPNFNVFHVHMRIAHAHGVDACSCMKRRGGHKPPVQSTLQVAAGSGIMINPSATQVRPDTRRFPVLYQ